MLTILISCVIISKVYSAPLQLQLMPSLLQQQQTSLQQQLLALQQLQLLQKLNSLQYNNQNSQRPVLILLPSIHKNTVVDEEIETKLKTNLRKSDSKTHYDDINEDDDSVTIEADASPAEETQKAILLIPNGGRFSIGDFISSIPFLPIEINVPDSISWIYDGISSIISGIGQRIPFRPQTSDTMQSIGQGVSDMRFKSPYTKRVTPILLMPLSF